MISLHNVIKSFGFAKAVDDISFEVNEGENAVLLGTSGCGKTTTLRMINRLIEVSSGEILVAGKNIKEIQPEELRRNIGYVLQYNGLFPHYTVAQNIAIVPELLKWPKIRINNRISELLYQLNLPEGILSFYPQQLSGGQQQRIGLARALAADPPILLMDEPFGSLDAITRSNITKEFSKLEALKNKTIVLVTHDIKEAFELGDTILLMDKGKIVQAGKAIDFLFHPKNNFVIDFFAGQKMLLQLNAILLKDIWQHLENSDTSENNLTEIDESKSLWEALELLNHKRNNLLSVKNSSSGEIKLAGYNSLFIGLEALKQKGYE
ncbi:MAG TPA: ATP-binding cassette domain-containing protein [Hanamia sp.]|nr:ATP-binding cassette domain-containing protein [Hanamia sp.]